MGRKKMTTDRRIKKLEAKIQEIEQDIELLEKDKKKVKHPKVFNLIAYWITARRVKLANLKDELNELRRRQKLN